MQDVSAIAEHTQDVPAIAEHTQDVHISTGAEGNVEETVTAK
jgi:hypothetical protein